MIMMIWCKSAISNGKAKYLGKTESKDMALWICTRRDSTVTVTLFLGASIDCSNVDAVYLFWVIYIKSSHEFGTAFELWVWLSIGVGF
jgi:hypothetical protein